MCGLKFLLNLISSVNMSPVYRDLKAKQLYLLLNSIGLTIVLLSLLRMNHCLILGANVLNF